MGMSRSAKIIRAGEFEEVDKALFVWLKQKRAQGIAATGLLLCEKALELSKMIYGNDSSFSASEGWRWRFGKRHGIHELVEHDEQLSADRPAAESFVESFRTFVADENFSNDQIFNCDETGLNFRLLPNRTLATASERSASGRKTSKDRVTINACANASGSLRVPLQVIGKSERPRCLRGIKHGCSPSNLHWSK